MSEQDVQPAAAPEASEPATVTTPDATADAVTPSPEPATPETPEWFMKDKYKTVEDQAKAQYEMRKLIGPSWGPPKDDYKTDSIEGLNPNDPILQKLKPDLKEMGLSQEGFERLVKNYQAAQLEGVKKMESDLRETLSQEDAVAITDVDNRLNEDFSKEVADGLRAMITTKEDFHNLRTLMALIPRKTNVPNSNANATPMETVQQVEQDKIKYLKEVKAGHRVEDKNHWDQLNARFRDAHIRETQAKR